MRSRRTAHSKPPLTDDAQLVHQAKSGNPDAFAQLYDAHVERVYRYIYFRVTDEATTEDLTSQVFLKAWENLERYKIGGVPFLAWLYTIARNLVIDHYRTQKETVPLEEIVLHAPEEQDPGAQAELHFDLQAIRDSLRSLTDDQQQVLILKFIAGMSNGHIAKMMNKKEGAVRALQMRALQTLSKRMEQKEMI